MTRRRTWPAVVAWAGVAVCLAACFVVCSALGILAAPR